MGWIPGRRRQSDDAYELAALQLQLLVGMAAADERLCASEIQRLWGIVDRIRPATDTDRRLDGLLRMLIAAPPTRDDMIRRVLAWHDHGRLVHLLEEDLSSVAHADARVDDREEELMRLLTAAAGLTPGTLLPGAPRSLTGPEIVQLHRLRLELPA